ncbi:major facilitator superfamily protein [Sarocladium implicatum]|nr:major facilitator superfamily protein [Sarocladium implicatum]
MAISDKSAEDIGNSIVTADDVRPTDVEKSNDSAPSTKQTPREVTGWKWIVVVFAILSSTFLFALDNTVVADVQAHIVLRFDSVGDIAWLSVAFIMAAVATNSLFGQLYSVFMPKWLYILSVLIFEVGSALCGAAPDMDVLIVGRALCGLGGIGMYIGVMSLFASTTTIQERPIYVASIGLTWGLGTILGPVVGGAFSESAATWRWAFYINLVFGAFAAPVYLFLLPSPDPKPGRSFMQRLSEVDIVGAPILLGAIVSFVMAINFGGIMYNWDSPQEIALFVVSSVLFLIFGVQQTFCIGVDKENRLFPVHLVTGKSARTVVIMFCTTASGGCGIFLPVYFIPIFFQFTRGDSPVEAAVRLLPFIIVLVVITLLQGASLSINGRYMPWFLVGGLLTVVGGTLMFLVDFDTSDARIYGYSALIGAGVGTFTQGGFSIAQASVDEADADIAAAFIALGQTSGITLGLAISNTIFLNRAEDSIHDILPSVPRHQVQAAIAGSSADFVESLGPEIGQRVIEAIVDAVSRTYILLITAGAFVTVLSLVMKREKLFIQPVALGG